MPTYCVDSPVAWAADDTLHAHITRTVIQRGLQAAYDNSGYDLDGALLSLDTGYHTIVPTASWVWTDLAPQPIRMLRKQGSTAYRDIGVEVLGELDGAGDTYLRAFILRDQDLAIDAVTGEVADYDYCTLHFTLAAQARKAGTITPSYVNQFIVEGISTPMAWLKIAITGDKDIFIYSVRVREGT